MYLLKLLDANASVGENFNNPKIYTLTGHGNVRRKPLADDGKSLRSRKSNDHPDDPFSERPQSSKYNPGCRRTMCCDFQVKPNRSCRPANTTVEKIRC